MADSNSSLPIQSITEGNSVKVSKDLNANAIANVIYVNLSDGVDVLAINNDGSINVAGTVTVTLDKTKIWDGTDTLDVVVINSAYGATPSVLPIAGKYEAAPTTYTDGDATPFLTDVNGRIIVTFDPPYDYVDDSAFGIATGKVVAMGALADETSPDSVDEGDIGIPRMTLDRKILVRITGANDGYRWDISSGGYGKVQISKDDNVNAETNPIYVFQVNRPRGGEVHDYLQSVAVGGGLSANHVYTITPASAKILLLMQVDGSASGKGRFEVQVGPVATLVTKMVKFNSTAEPNVVFKFDPPIEITEAGGTEQVKIIRTNKEGQAQDVYTLIQGVVI